MDRIPDEAVLRELYPVQGGATEGFEFKWVQNGQTYRVRVHNADPSAPVGSNAYNGWVVRVQRGRRYFDPTINDFREAKYFNPNGPDYMKYQTMNVYAHSTRKAKRNSARLLDKVAGND